MKELIETSIGIINPFGTRKHYILSDYTAMILRHDIDDDEEPILTIGQYSHEINEGFQIQIIENVESANRKQSYTV